MRYRATTEGQKRVIEVTRRRDQSDLVRRCWQRRRSGHASERGAEPSQRRPAQRPGDPGRRPISAAHGRILPGVAVRRAQLDGCRSPCPPAPSLVISTAHRAPWLLAVRLQGRGANVAEGTGLARVLDHPPPPPLVTIVRIGNGFAAGHGSIVSLLGERPLPRLALHVQVRNSSRDQSQERDASDAGSPDPSISPARHAAPLSASSPLTAGMSLPGEFPPVS